MARLRELVVKVSADVARLNRGMDRAERKVGRAMGAIKKAAAGAALAIGGIATIRGLAGLVKDSLDIADSFGKQAESIGFTAERYQELVFAADKAAIAQSQLNSNLTAFVKRVGEARANTGPLVSFLEKYDTTLLRAIQNSKSQNEALQLLANAMGSLESATDKAALANAAFSRAGVDMVRLLGDGGEQAAEFAKQAREMGLIISNDLVEGAADANDRLSILSDTIRLRVTEAVVRLAPRISELTEKVIELFDALLPRPLRAFTELEAYENRLSQVREEIERIENLSGRNAAQERLKLPGLRLTAVDLGKTVEFLRAIREEEQNIKANTARGVTGIPKAVEDELKKANEKAREEMAELRLILSTESIRGAGREDTEISLYRALEQQFEDLEAKAKATYGVLEEDGQETADTLADSFKGMGEDIERSITDAVTASQLSLESLADFANSVLESIARRLTSRFIAGPIGEAIEGGIGSIFGGERAAGGPTSAGKAYLVGERGPELFVPKTAGTVVPNGAMGGGAVNVNFSFTTLDPTTAAQVIAANRQTIVNIVRGAFNRGGSDPRLR